jgi:hypothetical protein
VEDTESKIQQQKNQKIEETKKKKIENVLILDDFH